MDIRPIIVTERTAEMAALIRRHWRESETHVSASPPTPLIEVYAALERQGQVVAFGAFDGEVMVGYAVALVLEHMHYGCVYGNHDVLFVHPDHRNSPAGLQLIRATEQAVAARGARMLFWHAKPDSSLDQILAHRGTAVEEHVYRKELV